MSNIKNPTFQQAGEFWTKMCKYFGTRWKYKRDAWEAKVIAKILDVRGIVSYNNWMNNYATILGRTIYIPFKPGQDLEMFSARKQISLCVHEHQHYYDACERGKVRWSWEYLTSSEKRAAAEASGYKTNLEMHLWFTGGLFQHFPSTIGTLLRATYDCDMKDVLVAENVMNKYIKRLERDEHYESYSTRKGIEILEGL